MARRTAEQSTSSSERAQQVSATPRRVGVSSPRREVILAGRAISYQMRVSARARTIRLVIRPETGLEIVLPRGASVARAEQALQEKAGWIVRTLDRVVAETAGEPAPLTSGRLLPFAGRQLSLALQSGAPDGRFRAALDADTLRLTTADASQETVRAALVAWYRKQARAMIAERLALWNAHYHFSFGRVSIKEQKSRWGSCSRQGNLNFNWRLLLAPLSVLDYVVIHELAHLKELNHSPRFWAIVAQTCPDYAAKRKWLRQHGRDLRF
ncbi:MAG TPA: SprT family zinc-dependent metalloprotease [Ktedonobacterales bacterium]